MGKRHGNNPMYNGSDCRDATAGTAINHVMDDEKRAKARAKALIRIIISLVNLFGYKVQGKLVLIDREDGRKYW
ncbi:MAG: hypothetical protein ACQ5SW_08325 [Sphaerochaetaceae bacterium]